MEWPTNPVLVVKPPGILSVLLLCISSQILTLIFLGFVPSSGAEAVGDVHWSPAWGAPNLRRGAGTAAGLQPQQPPGQQPAGAPQQTCADLLPCHRCGWSSQPGNVTDCRVCSLSASAAPSQARGGAACITALWWKLAGNTKLSCCVSVLWAV